MEELYKTIDILLEKLKDPKILKKTPTQIRNIRNELQNEFNKILKTITDNRRKKRTKKKKYVAPRIFISDSSDNES